MSSLRTISAVLTLFLELCVPALTDATVVEELLWSELNAAPFTAAAVAAAGPTFATTWLSSSSRVDVLNKSSLLWSYPDGPGPTTFILDQARHAAFNQGVIDTFVAAINDTDVTLLGFASSSENRPAWSVSLANCTVPNAGLVASDSGNVVALLCMRTFKSTTSAQVNIIQADTGASLSFDVGNTPSAGGLIQVRESLDTSLLTLANRSQVR